MHLNLGRLKKGTPHHLFLSELVIKKPEQYLEISSPFLNYRMSPFTIPTET